MSDNQNIYVLLTDTGTMFTKLIKRITAAPYNHASLALDENLNEVFSFGRKCANNPWIGDLLKRMYTKEPSVTFPARAALCSV